MGGMNRDNRKCFYCDEVGHMQNECRHREQQLRDGWTTLNSDGKLTMGDGSPIPRQGHPILKDRIEERHHQITKKAMMHEIVFDEPEPYQNSYETYRQPSAGQYANRVQQVYPQFIQGYGTPSIIPQMYVQPGMQPQNVQHQTIGVPVQSQENIRLAKLENLITTLQSQLVSTRGGAETNPPSAPANPGF
jgi:hypothetical protein